MVTFGVGCYLNQGLALIGISNNRALVTNLTLTQCDPPLRNPSYAPEMGLRSATSLHFIFEVY